MAGSVFDYEEDPDEQANGAGFAALLRGLPTDESSGQVNLPNGGAIEKTDSLMPWEAGPDSKTGLSSDDERGMVSEPAPVGKDDQPDGGMAEPGGPSSPDVDNPAQYGSGDTMPQLKQYGDWSKDYAAMQAQKASEDPSKYKASGWRRALAALAGGMVTAGSRDPAAGMRVGERALNAPLDKAKMQWAAQEAPLQAKLAADTAQDQQTYRTNQGIEQQGRLREQGIRNQYYGQLAKEHATDFAAQAAARRNALVGFTPDDPKDRNSTGTGTTADGRTVKGAQPPAWYQDKWDKDPTNKANAATQEGLARVKAMEDAGFKLSPEERNIIGAGGRPTMANRNSFRIPSAQSEEYNDWKGQFQRDNQRPPNAAEIAAFGHAGKGTGGFTKSLGDRIEANKGAGFRKAQSDFTVYKDPGAYQSDLQVVQNEYEQRLEDATGQEIPHVDITVDKDGKVNWGSAQQGPGGSPAPQQAAAPATAPQGTPAQAPARAATPPAPAPAPAQPAAPQAVKVQSGKTVKVGDPVTDGQGRTGTITGINPQTGKPKVKWSGAQ